MTIGAAISLVRLADATSLLTLLLGGCLVGSASDQRVAVTFAFVNSMSVLIANDSPFGLAAAVRTRDVSHAHRVAANVKAGIVWINDHHRLDPASPWGGVGDSGIGKEGGSQSFDDHFNTKSIMVLLESRPFDWYENTAKQVRLN